MPDVDMKDASAASPGDKEPATAAVPTGIKVADIVRNIELIVKAVETNTARLTTRAISRCVA